MAGKTEINYDSVYELLENGFTQEKTASILNISTKSVSVISVCAEAAKNNNYPKLNEYLCTNKSIAEWAIAKFGVKEEKKPVIKDEGRSETADLARIAANLDTIARTLCYEVDGHVKTINFYDELTAIYCKQIQLEETLKLLLDVVSSPKEDLLKRIEEQIRIEGKGSNELSEALLTAKSYLSHGVLFINASTGRRTNILKIKTNSDMIVNLARRFDPQVGSVKIQ